MPHELRGQVGRTPGPVAVVCSRYNENITANLLDGALRTLAEHQVPDQSITVAWVPGAWEVPLIAERLAHSGQYRAVICLAAVIRGETTHDQYINQQVSQSLGRIAMDSGVPTLFGVLTCNTMEQAIHRSGGRVGNKGSDCATAALEMADLMQQLTSVEHSRNRP